MKTSWKTFAAILFLGLAGCFAVCRAESAREILMAGSGTDQTAALAEAGRNAVKAYLLGRGEAPADMDALVAAHLADWVAGTAVRHSSSQGGRVEVIAAVLVNVGRVDDFFRGKVPPTPEGALDVKEHCKNKKEMKKGCAGKCAAPKPDGFSDVRVIGAEAIRNSGARTLGELLRMLPGVRITADRVMSMPASGPAVSADQFSRVLLLWNGHRLNKTWNKGADQEWETGFLESLREVRVYFGPEAARFGAGAFDMAIDLIPWSGADLKGKTVLAVSETFTGDGADQFRTHVRYGDTWGKDGDVSVSADFARWAGEEADRLGSWLREGDRVGRKAPSFQVSAAVRKGPWSFGARFLEHKQAGAAYCERYWKYVFAEAERVFALPGSWTLTVGGSYDNIDTRWGDFTLSPTGTLLPRTSVGERRLAARATLARETERTGFALEAEVRNDEVNNGPSVSGTNIGFMEYDTERTSYGAAVSFRGDLTAHWSARGALRLDKSGYFPLQCLPEAAVRYTGEATRFLARYSRGVRYEDTWWRIGSGNYNAALVPAYTPYVVGTELDPEVRDDFRAVAERRLGGGWTVGGNAFLGRYRNLMGMDWDFALTHGFDQVRAADWGGYSYAGATAIVRYVRDTLEIEGNLGYFKPFSLDLSARQLYVDPETKRPLWLSPLVGNLICTWKPAAPVVVAGRLHLGGDADNGGLDYASPGLYPVFDTAAYPRCGTSVLLDLTLRVLDLWQGFELQFSGNNLLNRKEKLPLVEGGYYYGRGASLGVGFRKTWK